MDSTGAERQRRYIERLKAQATDVARPQAENAALKAENAALKAGDAGASQTTVSDGDGDAALMAEDLRSLGPLLGYLADIVYSPDPDYDAAIADLADWAHNDSDDWMRKNLPEFIEALEILLPALEAVAGGPGKYRAYLAKTSEEREEHRTAEANES